MNDPQTLVAELSLLGIRPEGDQFKIRIEIGLPYELAASPSEWKCPIKLDPLCKLKEIHGVDSLQALSIALCLIGDILQDFTEKGGRLLYDDDGEVSDFDLNAYKLGNFSRGISPSA